MLVDVQATRRPAVAAGHTQPLRHSLSAQLARANQISIFGGPQLITE